MSVPLFTVSPPTTFVRIRSQSAAIEGRALIDTGATCVLIGTEEAQRLGYDLSMTPAFSVSTASGTVTMPQVILRQVAIGPWEVTDVRAFCYDLPDINVSILVGMSFLGRFRVTIDFKDGEIILDDC